MPFLFPFRRAMSLITLLLSACATTQNHYVRVEQHLAVHDTRSADAVIAKEEGRYGKNDRLLYLLDRGLSLSLAGNYQESNQMLDDAAQLSDQLYTESVTRHAAALLTNDNILPYGGEDFERVLIHIISALNYAQLNLLDDALVECRRVDTKLNEINDRYHDKKNRYKEDAFARYLAGILYEARGGINDAFISYRKAFETYRDWAKSYKTPIPAIIGEDLLRTTQALGLREEHEAYQLLFPSARVTPSQHRQSHGEIIVVSMHGRSPYKLDTFFDVVINKDILTSMVATAIWQSHVGSGDVPFSTIGQLVRVAVPRYMAQPSQVDHVEVSLSGTTPSVSASSVQMGDLTKIAIANLDDRIDRIRIKAITRATIKAIAVRKTSKKAEAQIGGLGGFALGKVAEVIAATSEVADKRSWRTLPDTIHLTRISVPPGDYNLATKFIGQDGRIVDSPPTQPVSAKGGEKKFVVVRTIY